MASQKRQCSSPHQQSLPLPKKFKNINNPSSSSSADIFLQYPRVALNPADCNLDFNIEGNGLIGHALYEEGFAYCWSGARGNIGISGGRYYFGCKILSHQPVNMEDTPSEQQNVCRIGISRGDDPVGNLGETDWSYGYGGTGKFSSAGRFVDYGEKFGIGDTIVCLVDLESKPSGRVEFSKNGRRLGTAQQLVPGPCGIGATTSTKRPREYTLFPHVLLKNTVVEMQFGLKDGLAHVEGYKPWAEAVNDGKAVLGPSLSDPTDCEVIMMVGLPASGKTTWAEKWIKEHPEKRYVLLGTNLVLEQMKVPGLLRKHNYGERFDRLMDRATKIFNTLLSRASKVPRNYIIDQTNVYKRARKRKLKPFTVYRHIAVVVFPTPDELKVRAAKRFREMGKEVPPDAVNEMIANFDLPLSKEMHTTDEYFDEIIFPELNRDEAQRHLNEMKGALASLSVGNSKRDSSTRSREHSLQSDSRISPYSLPGPEHKHPSSAFLRTPGRNWADAPADPVQPYPANVNTEYMRPVVPPKMEPFAGSYEGCVNQMRPRDAYCGTYSFDSGQLAREDLRQYGGHTLDPYRGQDAHAAYTYNNHGRPAYPLPNGPYGTRSPRPFGGFQLNVQRSTGDGPPPPPRYYYQ